MLDTTTLNAIEAASAVRPTGCWGQGAATRLIAWPRVGPPVPVGPRIPFMLPSLCCLAPSSLAKAKLSRWNSKRCGARSIVPCVFSSDTKVAGSINQLALLVSAEGDRSGCWFGSSCTWSTGRASHSSPAPAPSSSAPVDGSCYWLAGNC